MKRSDQKHLVYFVKFEHSLTDARGIAGSKLKMMLRQARATQMRTVRRFDDVASKETRWPSAAGKSIARTMERKPVREIQIFNDVVSGKNHPRKSEQQRELFSEHREYSTGV